MSCIMVFFVFSELKAIVRFVDIGGIVKLCCLNFLFIIKHLCQRLVQYICIAL